MDEANYRELLVWQKAMKLGVIIYKLVDKLPKKELYSLSDQMRRAAVSIPSNIAEGHSRYTKKDFAHFLVIARGSKSELETQLLLCVEVGYLKEADILEAMNLLTELSKMLTSFIKKTDEHLVTKLSCLGTRN